ncbi:MAG: oxidoreductase, 2OG-Fe(II) oxygenase, partial [Bacteroidota bacterium]
MLLNRHTDTIWTITDFLSAKGCEDLILFSEMRGYQEATVSLNEGAKMMKGIRNNYRLIYHDEKLATQYWNRLIEYCPQKIESNIAVGLNEQFRFYKYEQNQRFKRHIDGRFQRNE